MLEREDEPDDGDYFHIVELTYDVLKSSRDADERKIKDWTGVLSDGDRRKELDFEITDNNIFLVATSYDVYALSLDGLE